LVNGPNNLTWTDRKGDNESKETFGRNVIELERLRGFVNLRFHNKLILMALAIAPAIFTDATYGGVVVGDTPIDDNPQVVLGLPSSGNESSITVSRKQYVLSWNFDKRIPEWVAWSLNKRQLGDVTRSNVFRLDRDLDEALADQELDSVGPNDYKGSCLDRGHQVPSGDRTARDLDNEATFLMSNIMPQSAYLNRRTWVSLERFLRRQVLENNQVIQIYAGAIPYSRENGIGPQKNIQVPAANFKLAVFMPRPRDRDQKAKFFVVNFPNVTSKGTNPVKDQKQACWDSEHTVRLDETNRQPFWRDHLTKLNSVEKHSGIRFDFLSDAHEMTSAEVDALITEESRRYFDQGARSFLLPVLQH
jgi:DNA/RNA endonuclease G (NUC1)